ncbi:MAG: hypothetical protein LBT86_05150 [Deltaproteobacteria bacterium]|jgi:hypothetical protein|nr:hypothetical protein [Deltaproteobacteria bacterium]
MRKLLVLAFCFCLLAAAVPAKAQTKVEFEGTYKVLHHNLVNFSRASDRRFVQSDSFFENRLDLGINFKPNENLLFHWSLRGPDFHRWGANGGGAGSDDSSVGQTNAFTVYTRAIFATITQDWGELSIGRLEEDFPTSQAGLKTLGSTYGGDYIYTLPFDNSSVVDGISFTRKFDGGFGVNAYYAKDITDDISPAISLKDVDRDRFGVEPFFTWDGGGASLLLEYVRDMTPQDDVTGNYAEKNYEFYINPALTQAWGPFSVKLEGRVGWSETRYQGDSTKYKNDGLGLYLETTYNYGAGDINLMAWFADGSSLKENGNPRATKHDLVGMGDFTPFLVAYYGNALPGRAATTSNWLVRGDGSEWADEVIGGGNNHWGIGLLGNHAITDSIKINYGIGHFELVEEYWSGGKKDLGVEVDLGVHIQLLENLTFESQFGYMFNGKAYRNVSGYDVNSEAIYSLDAKDTFAWLSALTVSF